MPEEVFHIYVGENKQRPFRIESQQLDLNGATQLIAKAWCAYGTQTLPDIVLWPMTKADVPDEGGLFRFLESAAHKKGFLIYLMPQPRSSMTSAQCALWQASQTNDANQASLRADPER